MINRPVSGGQTNTIPYFACSTYTHTTYSLHVHWAHEGLSMCLGLIVSMCVIKMEPPERTDYWVCVH